MSRALDTQRAQHTIKRRTLNRAADTHDEFIIVAVHDLFVTIQEARARGTNITPHGTAFLSELTRVVLNYLEPPDNVINHDLTTTHNTIDGGPISPLFFKETQIEEPYPEGGLQAWLVVFGSWCGLMASIGMTNIMGSFQNYISENQLKHYDQSAIGWIFSLYAFLAFFGGIYVGPVFDKYGPRWLIFAGSIFVIADMMLLGSCTEYWHFMFVFGGLGGLGTALMFTPCIAAIGHWFKKGRGTATGIAVSSGALGGIVIPIFLEQLIPQIGFTWSMRVIGCIYIVLCIMANLLVKSRLPPIKDATAHPDLRIFSHRDFAVTVLGIFLLEWALFVPLAFICSYAREQGFSTSMSYNILVFLNIGSFFGRIIPGYIADRLGHFNTNIIIITTAVFSVLGIWWPIGGTTGGLIVFALLFGFASGSNISLAPVCLGTLCRTEEYGRYYATCFSVVSFGCLTGIPIAGQLISAAYGSYWGLIIFTGSCYIGGLMAFVSARVIACGWKLGVRY